MYLETNYLGFPFLGCSLWSQTVAVPGIVFLQHRIWGFRHKRSKMPTLKWCWASNNASEAKTASQSTISGNQLIFFFFYFFWVICKLRTHLLSICPTYTAYICFWMYYLNHIYWTKQKKWSLKYFWIHIIIKPTTIKQMSHVLHSSYSVQLQHVFKGYIS